MIVAMLNVQYVMCNIHVATAVSLNTLKYILEYHRDPYYININDLITVSDRLNFLMYADDTIIYFNLKDFDNLTKETDINRELEKVNIWLKLNKLSLNTQKTKFMLFLRNRNI